MENIIIFVKENWFFCYLCGINVLTFLLYGMDKKKAKRREWRISENTLLIAAVIGGSIGAFLGMYMFRHKTKKTKFYVGIPVIILLQVIVISLF